MDPNATDHEQIYIFCIMWSLGAFLENDERKKLEIYMKKHTKLKMPRLPDGDTIFNYNVNVHNGKWWHWNNLISDYVPPEITPQVRFEELKKMAENLVIYNTNYLCIIRFFLQIYSSLLIPNVSSIRTEFLIDLVTKNGHACLLMGEQV